jgi:peptide/nickel transport system ATP-binding protein
MTDAYANAAQPALPGQADLPLLASAYAGHDAGGSGPLLSARGVRVSFTVGSPLAARIRHEQRLLRAVDGVDLELGRGEALALVGESGSGKSTFALALAGLRPADSGEIRFDGRILPARRSRADQRRIQMVFQDPYSSLNPRLTVRSTLAELLRVHHVVPRGEIAEYSKELLTLVGLGEDALRAYPRQFSGGQRQRVAIARALALRPDVLVADEPVSALDVSVQATILNLLRDLRVQLGLSLLLISHNLAVVRHLCDRVAVMYLGRIVEVAPTEQLFSDPRHPYTRGLLAAIPRLAADAGNRASLPPAVAGDPPSALRIPAGCRFRTRCPIAQERCEHDDPLLSTAAQASGAAPKSTAAQASGAAPKSTAAQASGAAPDSTAAVGSAHLAACHFAFAGASASDGQWDRYQRPDKEE